jgi:signal transduction histidine kinase
VIFSGAVMGLVVSVGGWLAFAIVAMALVLRRQTLAARAESLARACHELRGPLAAARLGVELSAARPTASTARLRAIELELDRAAVALDDLQGVQRASGCHGERQLVDVGSWLRDSVEAWSAVAARGASTLQLHWEGPPASVRGERPRLAQATGNLIANAIEHGGGRVEIRGGTDGGRVHIEVRDQGPGLTRELNEWLQRDGRAIRRGLPRPRGSGRGRGLIIARTVASAHGGRLTTAPTDRGARLVLELPRADVGAQAEDAGSPPAAN